jgi:type IV secretion system protein VirB1
MLLYAGVDDCYNGTVDIPHRPHLAGDFAMKRDIAAVAGLLILSGCGMQRVEVRPLGVGLSSASPSERAYQEGKADLAAGQPGLAIVAFETALANDPGSVRVLNALGAAYDTLQRFDVAQSFYRQALQREPNSPDVANNMAISLQMAGKPEAMQWFARAERLDPKNPVIDANVSLAQTTPTAAPTMMAVRDDPSPLQLDQPRIERASPLIYEVQLPKDHPTDLGQMVRPESPRNVASVQRRISVPPIAEAGGPAPPIRNVVIPTPLVDDTANPTPLTRNTAGPEKPAAPAPQVGNITSQAAPPPTAPAAITASMVAMPTPAATSQTAPAARPAVTVFDPTLAACAPNVAPETLNAIIRAESGGNPLALHVNGTDQQPPPARDPAEAARVAESYVGQGYSVDVGLMQVNTRNLAATGHSIQQALDPCTNILHGSTILSGDYARAARTRGDDPYALLAALSAYNTGDFHRGFDNGYVAQVVSGYESPGPHRRHAAEPAVQHAAAAAPHKVSEQSERAHALKQELDRLEQTANPSSPAKLMASGSM